VLLKCTQAGTMKDVRAGEQNLLVHPKTFLADAFNVRGIIIISSVQFS